MENTTILEALGEYNELLTRANRSLLSEYDLVEAICSGRGRRDGMVEFLQAHGGVFVNGPAFTMNAAEDYTVLFLCPKGTQELFNIEFNR